MENQTCFTDFLFVNIKEKNEFIEFVNWYILITVANKFLWSLLINYSYINQKAFMHMEFESSGTSTLKVLVCKMMNEIAGQIPLGAWVFTYQYLRKKKKKLPLSEEQCQYSTYQVRINCQIDLKKKRRRRRREICGY